MTTTNLPETRSEKWAKIESSMAQTKAEHDVTWKAHGKGPFGRHFFIEFGTPATYSRATVRSIAERAFDFHAYQPVLTHIRRTDIKGAPWVPSGQFWSRQPAGEHFGFEGQA